MFTFRRPDEAAIRAFVDHQSRQPFTYPEVGATRGEAPRGYPLNHHRGLLGHGPEVYERARRAIDRWAMYDLGWTTLCWPQAAIAPGVTVSVLVRHLGFWSLNAARIVYVLEERDEAGERYGFAFGTLPEHAEQGEERFSVELRHDDQSVWYEIYTFARGWHWLVRLAYPLMRRTQKRFGRESVKAMQAAVAPGH